MKLERTSAAVFQESLYRGTTPAGLNFFCLPRRGYNKQHAALAIDFGAVDLDFVSARTGRPVRVPAGVAHFLEHKMFERKGRSAFDEFSRIGAQANAYTNYALTSYVFSTTGQFEKALTLLLHLVTEPYLTAQTVEKEKGIIEQEIRMYRDMPAVRAETNLMRALYHHCPVREEIGGTVESVKSTTVETLRDCFDTFYVPGNMALFVTGDVDPEHAFEIASAADWATGNGDGEGADDPAPGGAGDVSGLPRRLPPLDEPGGVRTRRVEERMASSMPIALVGFKDSMTGLSGKALASRQAAGDLALLALFGRSSLAFEQMYETGLVTDRFSFVFDSEHTYSHAVLGGETPYPERLAAEIARVAVEARKNGPGIETVNRLKRKAIGEFATLFNSPERLARVFCSLVFKGMGLFEYYDILRNVSLDDVQEVLGTGFPPERQAISIIWPEEMGT